MTNPTTDLQEPFEKREKNRTRGGGVTTHLKRAATSPTNGPNTKEQKSRYKEKKSQGGIRGEKKTQK